MSFGPSSNQQDDYKTDIKPDNSCPPLTDSISDISWITNQAANVFAASCWDGFLRVFDVTQGQYGSCIMSKLQVKINSPLTSCCWNQDNTAIFVGCGDGSIKAIDVNSSNVIQIGKHNAGISGLHYVPNQNMIISTAFENNIAFWKVGNNGPVFNLDVGNKVFCSDFQNSIFASACQNQKVVIFDLSTVTMGQKSIIDSIDLGKNSQIQSITVNQKGTAIGMGSIDGRANISTLSRANNGVFSLKSNITFKSNKQEELGTTVLYPVNSVDFNVINDKWFLTAGSDGALSIWDFQVKNKIKLLNFASNPICKAKVSQRGNMIAYGLGNDWHIGVDGINIWQPKVGVHLVVENETKFNFGK